MKKSIFLWSKTTLLAAFIIILLCLTHSCQQQVEEGITMEEANALAKKDLEIWNDGNMAIADEIIAPDYVQHSTNISEDVVGIDAFKGMVTGVRTTYPDFNLTVEELIVKDDRIVWVWIITGTNTGTANDIPPTGKKMRCEGVGILRVVDGKIVERLIYYNEADMLTQLGYKITLPNSDI